MDEYLKMFPEADVAGDLSEVHWRSFGRVLRVVV